MKLTFITILVDYLSNCLDFKYQLERENLSATDKKYIEGRIKQNFYNFENSKAYLNIKDLYKTRKPTKEEEEKYKIEGDFPLVRILEYRDKVLPIYLDDYGQQEFAVYKNKEISGGAFNTDAEEIFMWELDSYLEKEFFASDLDEPEEWKKVLNSIKRA